MNKLSAFLSILILPILTMTAVAETAKSVTVEIPIFSQKVRFSLPDGWKNNKAKQFKQSFLAEFTPVDEELDSWTNLFALQAHQNFDPTISPEQVSDSYAAGFVKLCPKSVIYSKLKAQQINGHQAYLSLMGCANMPVDTVSGLKKGMSEISFYIFVKGTKDLYIFQKSLRGDGFDPENLPASIKQSVNEMKSFSPMQFCNLDSPKGKCLK